MNTPRKIKKMLYAVLTLCAVLALALCLLPACAPRFGALPEGERLRRVEASPHYRDGRFRNLEPTVLNAEDSGAFSLWWNFFFKKWERRRPDAPLPMRKTDLRRLDPGRDCVVWLGHASSYLQLGGRRLLIDPVFGDHAAPFSFLNRAFPGPYPYGAADMPDIDLLLLSHDHWDHLEHPTMLALKERVRHVVCPLGVGAHLERWGFAPERVHEGDWNERLALEPGLTVHVLPARHFSGRWLKADKTLWAGFLVETPGRRVFYSGDSGFGGHFAEIGGRFPGIDLALLANGQYSDSWPDIHMTPEQTARAAEALGARAALPVHAGRFTIAYHPWDEPYKRLAAASRDKPFRLLTPVIGEPVFLDETDRAFPRWWEEPTPSPRPTPQPQEESP